ncbi:hypothetical protein E5E96_16895 [Aeromonas sp. 1805]|uniref:hypothetical protein n=1 Tax=Aeromonas sp. 1805 TaxID=2560028 RepID=UPI00148B139D|nr:hypothetical protein [Aeromonas sp. 1805]QJT18807.1 hypothetical protein E5E96_16895 [Aeromonas sp. 1805]
MWKYVSVILLSSGVFAGTPGGVNVTFFSLDDIAGKYNNLFIPVLTGETELVCKDSHPDIEWGAENRPVSGINAAELLKSMKDLSIRKRIRVAMNSYSYKYIDGIDVLIFTNVDGSEMNISFYALEEKNDRLLKVDLNDDELNGKLNNALCMGLSKIPLRVDSVL